MEAEAEGVAVGAAKLKACADTPSVFDDDGSGNGSDKGVAAPELSAALTAESGAVFLSACMRCPPPSRDATLLQFAAAAVNPPNEDASNATLKGGVNAGAA